MSKTITCSAPVNIAVIKYWGKRDEELILPTNSSLSCTLSQDQLQTRTSVSFSPTYTKDRLWLNGKEEDVSKSARLRNCLSETRRLRSEYEASLEKKGNSSVAKLSQYFVHAASINNFPTAAGLASSASGYACFVFALCKLYELPISVSDMSRIARTGSGSACRSLFGGFVAWEMGQLKDGSDSQAVQIAPETHWPEIEAIILVVSDAKKATSSTSGMQTTVQTSELLQHRISEVVPRRMKEIIHAIEQKDFKAFAEITMKDSNQFHAVCLDTYPPICYLNDVSKKVIELLTAYNSGPDGIKAAYTFDAGPNAVIYAPKANIKELIQFISFYFPSPRSNPTAYFPDPLKIFQGESWASPKESDFPSQVRGIIPVFPEGSINRIIHTPLGDGPRVLDEGSSLLTAEGLPKEQNA
ncbi:diphosphomevalonate decarboxylase [Entomophthora muscae]|uniref:Diphosphomevalonate decarboxylase n=1 Tax=Entomophthora muscae TaxID=34485 RepID=A0ACC2U3M6_9FUNG|nr:diphosphomevalonate decarboxylase [Entomophthora muscae]